MPPKSLFLTAASALCCAVAPAPAATLHVANWNLANHPNNTEDQQQLRTILGYAGAIDLLTMAETDTSSAIDTATVFGSVYGGTYASLVATADGGGDRTGFVYNTAKLSLVGQSIIGAGTLTHPTLRAAFRPLGTTGSEDFYVYATHLVSGSSSTIKNQRVNQAQFLRTDADTLGSANVIVAGDFNWQKADDVSAGVGAYRTFAASGSGQVTDPLNRVGDWHGNAAYRDLLTEDPDRNLDDRFDMQLTSGELLDGRGLDYKPGSYRVVGNEGTVAPGGVITASSTLSANVVAALGAFSDHLPVLADYGYRILGDATGDDRVDFNDFLVLQNNFSKPGTTYDQGNFNYDAATDFNDFLILQNNFGHSIAGTAAMTLTESQAALMNVWASTVPEPTGFAAIILGLMLRLRRRVRIDH